MKKTFDARSEVIKYGRPFATSFGSFEILYEPHLLGSMVTLRSKVESELKGTYLFADLPPDFVVALGAAARALNASKKGNKRRKH